MFHRIRALFMLSTVAVLLAGCEAAMLHRGLLPEPGSRTGSDLPDAEVVDLTPLKKVTTSAPAKSVVTSPKAAVQKPFVEILDDAPAVSSIANSTKFVETLSVSQRDIHAVDCSKDRIASVAPAQVAQAEPEMVSAAEDDSAAIAGAIAHPGTYLYKEGMLVSALIRSAGGFLPEANLRRAVIVRPLSIPAAFTVGERSSHRREITISVDLAAIIAGDKDADIALNRLDTLKILSNQDSTEPPTVTIIGGIRKPGVYKLTPNLTLGQLIQLAGGPTSDAVADESRIMREKHSTDDVRTSSVTYKFRLSDISQHLADYDLTLANRDQITINSQPSK